MFKKSPELERDLAWFGNDDLSTMGIRLLNPEVVSDKELEIDKRKITRRVKSHDQDIRRLEDEREEIIKEMAEEPSERRKRLLAQKAGEKARDMDAKDAECDDLFLRRSLIRGIQHVRTKFEDTDSDLAIDDILEGEDHESAARELEDYLAEQGVERDNLAQILGVLDMEMQRDSGGGSRPTDSYAEDAMREAEQLAAHREDADSHADDIDTDDEDQETESNED